MNTELTYRYRDAANYKTTCTVVLEGEFSDEQLSVITGKLEGGDGFIPSQVGLDDLQYDLAAWDDADDELDDNDHVWHEWPTEFNGLELVRTAAPADGPSCQQLAAAFAAVQQWDVTGAVAANGIPS